MCEACLANVDYWNHVIPDFALGRATKDGNWVKKDQWCLTQCNDPSFWFDVTPQPCPLGWPIPDFDDVTEEQWDLLDPWFDEVAAFKRQLQACLIHPSPLLRTDDPVNTHVWTDLVISLSEAGLMNDRNAALENLFHLLGRYLEDNPTPYLRHDDMPDGDKDERTWEGIGR